MQPWFSSSLTNFTTRVLVLALDGWKNLTGVKKTVRFYPITGVRKVSKLDDLVPAHEIWYSPDELHNLRPDVKQINRLYKNCGSECVRGLEYCTKQGTLKRSCSYTDAWLAVMDEQTLQDKSGIHDPASIAKAYARVSQRARSEAHIKGLLDEAFCQEYVHCLPISTKAKEAQENQDWDSLKVCTCCATGTTKETASKTQASEEVGPTSDCQHEKKVSN
jgi:hypothetical protein